MIGIHSKHDNMNKNGIFYALIYINNNINTCIDYMLSMGVLGLVVKALGRVLQWPTSASMSPRVLVFLCIHVPSSFGELTPWSKYMSLHLPSSTLYKTYASLFFFHHIIKRPLPSLSTSSSSSFTT